MGRDRAVFGSIVSAAGVRLRPARPALRRRCHRPGACSRPNFPMITLADIEAARERIAGGVYFSPCVESIPLSQLTGAHIFCKLDYLQRTGSFKERGARNALLLLSPEQRRRGVIAASAGNHAQGIAYHGSLLGIPVTVVMPKFAALIKVTNCRHAGRQRRSCTAPTSAKRARKPTRSPSARGSRSSIRSTTTHVIAGQGTMALEILEQTPDVEAIVVPVGGGGLLAGIGTVVKALRPDVHDRRRRARARRVPHRRAGRRASPVPVALSPTLADGLAVPHAGQAAVRSCCSASSTRWSPSTRRSIALAILRLIELEKSVVEGAGAAPLAAFLAGKLDDAARASDVVLVLVRRQHRPHDARPRDRGRAWSPTAALSRFTVSISDRPGGLARLAELIASTGASIKEIVHDRAFSGPDLTAVRVVCVVETTGHTCARARTARRGLAAAGMQRSPIK